MFNCTTAPGFKLPSRISIIREGSEPNLKYPFRVNFQVFSTPLFSPTAGGVKITLSPGRGIPSILSKFSTYPFNFNLNSPSTPFIGLNGSGDGGEVGRIVVGSSVNILFSGSADVGFKVGILVQFALGLDGVGKMLFVSFGLLEEETLFGLVDGGG